VPPTVPPTQSVQECALLGLYSQFEENNFDVKAKRLYFYLCFLQGGYDSDFLDDTALIKAFDNAINPIKVVLITYCTFSCNLLTSALNYYR